MPSWVPAPLEGVLQKGVIVPEDEEDPEQRNTWDGADVAWAEDAAQRQCGYAQLPAAERLLQIPILKKNIHLCRVLHATDRCQVVCKAKRKMDRQECPCWGGRKLNMEGEEQAERGRERTRTFREGDGSGVEWSTSRHSRRGKCQGKALQSWVMVPLGWVVVKGLAVRPARGQDGRAPPRPPCHGHWEIMGWDFPQTASAVRKPSHQALRGRHYEKGCWRAHHLSIASFTEHFSPLCTSWCSLTCVLMWNSRPGGGQPAHWVSLATHHSWGARAATCGVMLLLPKPVPHGAAVLTKVNTELCCSQFCEYSLKVSAMFLLMKINEISYHVLITHLSWHFGTSMNIQAPWEDIQTFPRRQIPGLVQTYKWVSWKSLGHALFQHATVAKPKEQMLKPSKQRKSPPGSSCPCLLQPLPNCVYLVEPGH